MVEAEQPLSKESFGNNADLLVYRDRHEYRTRSRLTNFTTGTFFTLSVAFAIRICLALIRESADTTERILYFAMAAVFSPLLVFIVLIALACFRSNPWIVITPAGVEFHNRLASMGLRIETFRVQFPDIDHLEMKRWAEGGRFQVQPASFRHALKIYTEDRGGLVLPWSTFNKDEAARFEAAFWTSITEMASRALGAR